MMTMMISSLSRAVLRRNPIRRCHSYRSLSRGISTRMDSEDPELKEFLDDMEYLKNYEKSGVPTGAGTDCDDGFDLGWMRRLMERLGNPQSKLKAYLVASPHIRTIRERIRVGPLGEPVSTPALSSLFYELRKIIDEAVELENGCLSHLEVLTAMTYYLFARENVDFAVVEAGLGGARDATYVVTSSDLAFAGITMIGEEHLAALGGSLERIATAKSGIIKQGRPLVLGGPFPPPIERVIHNKALLISSPVVSMSESGNRSKIKALTEPGDRPHQICDLVIHIDKEIRLSIELLEVNLCMLGVHQLHNAATATCAALCLREQAHTNESAKALVRTFQMAFPNASLILVVPMANDKDHVAFAREFLAGTALDAVFFTEVEIAGGKTHETQLLC